MTDFERLMKQAMFDIENDVYNAMMKDAFAYSENKFDKAGYEFFLALNRRGVSSKTIFEALKEAGKAVKETDE